MIRFSQILRYWLPALLYAALIITLSSQSKVPGAGKIPDKPEHFIEYFGFAIFLSRAVLSGKPPAVRPMLVVLILASAFAAFDEYYQSFIPGRTSSVYDWAADFAGIGLWITLLLRGSRRSKAPA